LADESILSDELVRQLISVGEVDLLVGLPTYNDAQTVGQVVQVIRAGLLKYFPRERAAILNADGGSQDETPSLVQAASISDARNPAALRSLRTLHCISTRYSGNPSRAAALHTIVAAADLLQAKACAVIAPESSNIEPEWIDRLLRPVCREGFDFVTPLYRRHKFEGMLVTNLLYPMTRAIYGWRIREPYPAEFAFSGRFGSLLVGHEMWREEACRAGTEICFTLAAVAGGFRLHQSFLGPKGHPEQAPPDLVPAVRQTVGTLFWSMDQYSSTWSTSTETKAVPTLGAEYEFITEPVRVNRERLYQMFRSGVAELEPVLASILSRATLDELKRSATLDERHFQYDEELWVKTIYEFAASYHRSVISRDHIIQALVPLYRGRMYTFLLQNQEASEQEVEQHIESLCLTFERSKPYLLELWRGEKGGSYARDDR
jgi:glucosylglycerate synthase